MLNKIIHSAVVTTWASLLTKISTAALITPLVISKLPPNEAYKWLVLSTIYSLFLLLDFGLTPTLARYIAYTSPKNQTSYQNNAHNYLRFKQSEYIAAINYCYKGIAVIGITIIIPTTYLLLYKQISELPYPIIGWLCVGITIASVTVTLWGGGAIAYLQGINKIAQYRLFEALIGLVSILTILLTISHSNSIIWLTIAINTPSILATFYNRYLVYKDFKKAENNKRNTEIIKEIWKTSWRTGVGVLAGSMAFYMTSLIVAKTSTTEEANVYLLLTRLVSAITLLGNVPFYVTLPTLAANYVNNNSELIFNLTLKRISLSNSLVAICIFIVSIAIQYYPKIIPPYDLSSVKYTWLLLGIACIIERTGAMYLQVYTLTNNIIWHKLNTGSAVIMLILMPLLYPLCGINSFPLAAILAYGFYYAPVSIKKSSEVLGNKLLIHFSLTSLVPLISFLLLIYITV